MDLQQLGHPASVHERAERRGEDRRRHRPEGDETADRKRLLLLLPAPAEQEDEVRQRVVDVDVLEVQQHREEPCIPETPNQHTSQGILYELVY